MNLLLTREIARGAGGFQTLLHPTLLGRIGHVLEFSTDRSAVGVAQRLQQIAQRRSLATKIGIADVEHDVHVGIGEAVEGRLEFRNVWAFLALQRVEIRPLGTEETVGGDQLGDGNPLAAHLGISGCGNGTNRTLLCTLGKGGDHAGVRHIGTV